MCVGGIWSLFYHPELPESCRQVMEVVALDTPAPPVCPHLTGSPPPPPLKTNKGPQPRARLDLWGHVGQSGQRPTAAPSSGPQRSCSQSQKAHWVPTSLKVPSSLAVI